MDDHNSTTACSHICQVSQVSPILGYIFYLFPSFVLACTAVVYVYFLLAKWREVLQVSKVVFTPAASELVLGH